MEQWIIFPYIHTVHHFGKYFKRKLMILMRHIFCATYKYFTWWVVLEKIDKFHFHVRVLDRLEPNYIHVISNAKFNQNS
jgi:hypothetical protein